MKTSKDLKTTIATNRATWIITSTLGIAYALSGMLHGFFEILQGNKATDGLIIQAISEEFQRWPNGEEAFTLIPNFLITGVIAISISIVIIVWSIGYLHKNNGTKIFLLLFIALTLTGGGIGYIVFFVPTWAYATQMNKSLSWWKRKLPEKLRKIVSKTWGVGLILTVSFFIIALTVSVLGINGASEQKISTTCFLFLLGSIVFYNYTFIAGFAQDIEYKVNSESHKK